MLAVHFDVAATFQFNAWQLLDECVKHGAFGQLESIGIVNERIAVDVELYLRGLHHHLAQHHLALLLNVERLVHQVHGFLVSVETFHLKHLVCSLIAVLSHSQYITAGTFDVEHDKRDGFVVAVAFDCAERINERTVCCPHQFTLNVEHGLTRKYIGNFSYDSHRVAWLILLLCLGIAQACTDQNGQ